MTAQRIRSGSDASGIPVPLSKVLPQRLAESAQQIRPVADRIGRAKGLALPDSADRSDALRELVPDGVEAFGREHAHARQLVRRLVGPVRQSVQVEPAPILHQSELPQSRGLAGRGIERLGEPVAAVHIELAAPQTRASVVNRGRTDRKGLDVPDQTEVAVMPICIAHEVVDHEPIVRGVTNHPFVCAEADGGADPLVMRVEAIDGLDGLEHLPGGDQLLMIGEHVRACGHQTVAVACQGIPDGRNAQSHAEPRGDDLVHGLLARTARLDEQPPAGGPVDRPAFGKIAASGHVGDVEADVMGRRVRGEQDLAQRLVEGIVEEVDVLPFGRIVLASDPVLVRQAQPVGPVEQFAGRCRAKRFEHAADAVAGGGDGAGPPPFVDPPGIQRALAMRGELQRQTIMVKDLARGARATGLGIVFERKNRMVPAHDQLARHDSAPSKLGL